MFVFLTYFLTLFLPEQPCSILINYLYSNVLTPVLLVILNINIYHLSDK